MEWLQDEMQKSICFVSSNSMEIGRKITFTVVPKTLKYLEINIVRKGRVSIRRTLDSLIEG